MGLPTRVLLGVSGGIAAYKSLELVRRLRERGVEVRVVMTEAATHFVQPLAFQALSGGAVRTTLWDAAAEAAMGHIELARWAELILIAPASADLIARLALGMADDLLSTLVLASAAPVVLAPAMNRQMYAHPATQANLAALGVRGVTLLGPAAGAQACGEVGPGRMLEPAEIIEALDAAASSPLRGRRVLVNAGPTLEDLDPVRFIGNRSSGRMGFEIAAAARRLGAEVVLVAGPVTLPTPPGVRRIDVRSAEQMLAACLAEAGSAQIFIGAAAVADYRAAEVLAVKRKRAGVERLSLELVRNPDVIAEVVARFPGLYAVGFAAETLQGEALIAEARRKRFVKGLALVCANTVGEGVGFEVEENALCVVDAEGTLPLGPLPKSALAMALMREIAARLEVQS
ncbi:MAG: bifunctional phosphopantothenoylcysteine decarboxylase/phosphopantothenate--cysteine ligase CoaBC [Xanthomonadales bacterium]|jgi:phosphopantothenoylcysteine decarboxylase/phosphopantothenate--cysteine ligase|nr:bifunctional phosphopantothenoylcysteine decarboxylase/phosphopantothenate--cysteine ligase CoaBC [Xanthomonadales bacterium]